MEQCIENTFEALLSVDERNEQSKAESSSVDRWGIQDNRRPSHKNNAKDQENERGPLLGSEVSFTFGSFEDIMEDPPVRQKKQKMLRSTNK